MGACLYRLLTNARPFVAAAEGGLVEVILTKDPLPIRDLRPEVPAALAFIVERCMKKKPDDRFASATELRKALGLALAATEIPNVALEIPNDDETVQMSNAPMRPAPVRSTRPPATQPMAPVRPPTPMPPPPAAAPAAAVPIAQQRPSGPAPPMPPFPTASLSTPPPPESKNTLYVTIAIVAAVVVAGVVAGVAACLHALAR